MSARRIKALVLFLFVGLLLNLAGCSSGTRSKVEVAIANVPRAEPQVDQGLLDQQVAANNAFALDLYRSLRGQDGNLFYSPYSLSIALAITYAGARGETEQQMRATLHYLLPQDQLHPVFNLLDRSLNTPANEDTGFQLSAINSLWGQKEFPFLPDYLDLIARNYGAGVRLVDFSAEKNREEARQQINEWVSQQTNDKIKDLLSKEMLDEDTILVLANAVYFKGEWVDPFTSNSSITPFTLPFTLPDGQEVDVTMMTGGQWRPISRATATRLLSCPTRATGRIWSW
jgi:serpin B